MLIEFDKASHTYRVNGKAVPSVTQVLDPLLELDGVPRAVLEAARVFGTHVHEACHLLVRDELDWARLDPGLVPYVNGARRFLKESRVVVIASELRVASATVGCAGTLDLVAVLKRSESIFDWKSTATLPRTIGPQTAGYENFYREERGGPRRKRFGVQLLPDDYRLYPLTDPADWSVFLSALNLHHWRHKHAPADRAA